MRGIHRSPVNSPHKGQWSGTLLFSFISAWINGWANNREAGDLRRHCAYYDVIVMSLPVRLTDQYCACFLLKTICMFYHSLRTSCRVISTVDTGAYSKIVGWGLFSAKSGKNVGYVSMMRLWLAIAAIIRREVHDDVPTLNCAYWFRLSKVSYE